MRAKILSEIKKPMGVCIGVDEREFLQASGDLPVKNIPYIGRSSQEKLRFKIPSHTIRGFMEAGFWEVKRLLGKNGADTWLELRGVNTWQPR